MEKSYPEFVESLKKTDPVLYETVTRLFDQALAPGELDARTKVLVALALDAYAGAEEGVRVLSGTARQMGVTDAQIAEVLRIAYLVAGNMVLSSSARAFES